MAAIESPCVKLCVVDPVTDHCIGCGRSLAEIAGWIGLEPAARRAIMADLPARLQRMTVERPRRGGRTGRLARIGE